MFELSRSCIFSLKIRTMCRTRKAIGEGIKLNVFYFGDVVLQNRIMTAQNSEMMIQPT